jgi:multiple sugar transport system ATP-binding protein
MPRITLKNITKKFGKALAVDRLDMVIEDGDFVTLLGPSGCGKTTTLRMIAGLETPTEGEISIGDRLVFSSEKGVDIPADRRDVGFLFQNYALWPHMTVKQNISFGLENLKWPKDRIAARVAELCETLRIREYVDRYPSELSGGQQQRVAIARTLATGPAVLLMDEPLSNLDAKLRTEMRAELKRLHAETKATFVYVTHDQLEAMTLSSRTCLMKDGSLQQYAPPMEVYAEPANVFTADFVGSPTINFLEGTVSHNADGHVGIDAGGLGLTFLPDGGSITASHGQEVVLGVRPEYVRLGNPAGMKASVYSTLPSGMETIVKVTLGDTQLTSVVFGSVDYEIDSEVTVDFTGNRCLLFACGSGERLGSGELRLSAGSGGK